MRKRKLENKKFKIDDKVEAIERRACCAKDEKYILKGKIAKIIGPEPADEEYEKKWLGGNTERLISHVWRYAVAYICPVCGLKGLVAYYAPGIKLMEKK